jgi:hypothetical protein
MKNIILLASCLLIIGGGCNLTYDYYGEKGKGHEKGKSDSTQQEPKSEVTLGPGCMVTGCSNQLCINEEDGDVVTTCEFKDEYTCYQKAKCEKRYSGKCGWILDAGLEQCILDNGGTI